MNGVEIFYTENLFNTGSIVGMIIMTLIIFLGVLLLINYLVNYNISYTTYGNRRRILKSIQVGSTIISIFLLILFEHYLYEHMSNQKVIHAQIHKDASYRDVINKYEILDYNEESGVCTLKEKGEE